MKLQPSRRGTLYREKLQEDIRREAAEGKYYKQTQEGTG